MHIPPRSRGVLRARAEHSYLVREVLLPVQAFLHTEAHSGILLLAAAVVAIAWANSPWAIWYVRLWETVITVDVGLFALSEDLRHWVNDGLMAVFFFVVGLEIKREVVHGALAGRHRAVLPVMAALGGIVVPALCYLTLNAGGPGARGWGIPMATDIAFALGVLTLLGPRLPSELRVFLLALAIVDDLGAILVVAVFYTHSLAVEALGIALGVLGIIAVAKRIGVLNFNVYIVLGALFWVAVLKSGIHATLAGVVLGVLTPLRPSFSHATFAASAETLLQRFRDAQSVGDTERADGVLGQFEELNLGTEAPLERLERLVHPWSSYLIMPAFALANAGLTLSGAVVGEAVASPISLGIITGLVIGKLVGVVGFAWLAVRLRLAALPLGVCWSHMVGIGMLAGIGFTMSLFLTGIAFEDPGRVALAKVGILTASVLSGVGGYFFLRLVPPGACTHSAR